MDNEELKEVYDEMHTEGSEAWFGDGKQEAADILDIGHPWDKEHILEIGCGEGWLAATMRFLNPAGIVWAIDYSEVAIQTAVERYKSFDRLHFGVKNYQDLTDGIKYDRIIMQGVLEHLDEPFTELQWMIDNLLISHGDIITSSPSFLNPRGFIWMVLNMLGAVMSKTDLHFLNPWDFEKFCKKHKYQLTNRPTDYDWGGGERMVEDMLERIPLALRDGEIPYKKAEFERFIRWLRKAVKYTDLSYPGATTVYRIQT